MSSDDPPLFSEAFSKVRLDYRHIQENHASYLLEKRPNTQTQAVDQICTQEAHGDIFCLSSNSTPNPGDDPMK